VAVVWRKVTLRIVATGLLLGGAVGGWQLGEHRTAGVRIEQSAGAAEEMVLLKERHNRQIAARSSRARAENAAATKARTEAKTASGKAKALDKSHADKVALETACDGYSGNRATGCNIIIQSGKSIAEFRCLDRIWTKESGWNHKAENPSSGAYGIPQSYPAGKMASAGADWRTNPATQIKWGLGYINGRYGSPCGAWSHWQANHSY
jgi:hypothetical protein